MLTHKEINDIFHSISYAEETIEKGLISDPEAESQIRRMCFYYRQQIDNEQITKCPYCGSMLYKCDRVLSSPMEYVCHTCARVSTISTAYIATMQSASQEGADDNG